MAQMGKTDQLKAYIADLVKDTHEVSEIVQHSSPALAAFIQAKQTIAVGKGIAFTYELPSNWNIQETSIKIIDIVKIMGNLVDNAFDETGLLPMEQRKVHASVHFENHTIQIVVTNSGRVLDAKERDRIFLPGYSTKGENHSGLGLAIVLERVRHYNGDVEVRSEEGNPSILFKITLPHNELTAVL
jgi:sensor histidine kinase regulating citrate/malate metabolism